MALAAVTLFAGCGTSRTASSSTESVAAKHRIAGKVRSAAPAHRAKRPRHRTRAAPSTPSTPVIDAGALIGTRTGTGNQAIGTLIESSEVVLRWSTTKPPLQIFDSRGFLVVDSQSATGSVRLARGSYKGLRIATKGHWTVQVHASA